MNIFNRILMIIFLLFFIFISAVGIVNIFYGLFDWDEIPSMLLSSQIRGSQLISTSILAGIFLISLVILIFEFYRRRTKKAVIYTDGRGKSMVTTDSISKQVNLELLKFEEIVNARVKTLAKKNGVYTDIYIKIIDGLNVGDFIESAREAVFELLSAKLSLDVIKIDFTVTGFYTKKEKEVEEDSIFEEAIISQVKEELEKEELEKQAAKPEST